MPRYSVMHYRVVGIRTTFIEADSMTDAIEKSEKLLNFHHIIDQDLRGPHVIHMQDCEEPVQFLVDEQGDDNFEKSQFFDIRLEPIEPK